DMHCRHALSDGRNPLLPSLPKGFAKTLDGADEAPRRLERTDLCPEFHQRLIDKEALSGVDELVRLSPQTLGILLTPGLNPRQHAAHITINDWVWLVEGDAQDGPSHISADAGKLDQHIVIRWDFAVMLRRHLPRCFHQVLRAAVIAKSSPQAEHTFFVCLCKRFDRWKFPDEALVIRQGRLDLGLLEHHLGEPDLVRIVGNAPGQWPVVFLKPGDKQ